MAKYYAIWDKNDGGRWWTFLYSFNIMYTFSGFEKIKRINDIPIWREQDHCKQMLRYLRNSNYEIKPFTPADALLEKCRRRNS